MDENQITTIVLVAGFSLFIIGGLIYVIINNVLVSKVESMNKKLMESFAQKHRLIYFKEMSIQEKQKDTQLLNTGTNRSVFNYMKGDYQGNKIEIYNYQQWFILPSVGIAKYYFTVLEFNTNEILPTSIITASDSYYINTPLFKHTFDLNQSNSDKLETESNEFNEWFTILIKKSVDNAEKLKLLEILAPNIINLLIEEEAIDENRDINIETKGNKLILYISPHPSSHLPYKSLEYCFAKNEDSLKRLLDLGLKLVEEAE